MIRRPPRSTLFPYRRSSDLLNEGTYATEALVISRRFVAPVCRMIVSNSRCSIASTASTPGCSGNSKRSRSEEHTSELQSRSDLVCHLLLEKKNSQQLSTKPL